MDFKLFIFCCCIGFALADLYGPGNPLQLNRNFNPKDHIYVNRINKPPNSYQPVFRVPRQVTADVVGPPDFGAPVWQINYKEQSIYDFNGYDQE